jgi:hypothetical protein
MRWWGLDEIDGRRRMAVDIVVAARRRAGARRLTRFPEPSLQQRSTR